ncbi:MAG: GGDEF domain-containing protein [Deltaproteobacteria bacterium]|nr:GGDEF domain-containing protein [Deltaproteobacteria bacterium]
MSAVSLLAPEPARVPPAPAPLWRDPLRWTATERALGMAVLVCLARLVAAVATLNMYLHPETTRLVRPDLVPAVTVAMGIQAVVWIAICLVGVALQRRELDVSAYVATVLGAFWLTNALFIYSIGVTSPAGWVLLVAMALLIHVLFTPRYAYGGMTASLCLAVATQVAVELDWLPYAPMLSAENLWQQGRPSSRLLLATGVSTLMAAVPLLVTGHMALARLRDREQQLDWLSRVDALTGLANRRAFLERLESELARVQRGMQSLSVAILDVDHFKQVNDRHGHAVGDRALEQIAHALRTSVRTSDLVARVGGEELAVLMPGTDAAGARVVAERCRTTIAGIALIAKGQVAQLTATFGVVSVAPGQANMSIDRLLACADQGLYAGKNKGRNCVVFGEMESPGSTGKA